MSLPVTGQKSPIRKIAMQRLFLVNLVHRFTFPRVRAASRTPTILQISLTMYGGSALRLPSGDQSAHNEDSGSPSSTSNSSNKSCIDPTASGRLFPLSDKPKEYANKVNDCYLIVVLQILPLLMLTIKKASSSDTDGVGDAVVGTIRDAMLHPRNNVLSPRLCKKKCWLHLPPETVYSYVKCSLTTCNIAHRKPWNACCLFWKTLQEVDMSGVRSEHTITYSCTTGTCNNSRNI